MEKIVKFAEICFPLQFQNRFWTKPKYLEDLKNIIYFILLFRPSRAWEYYHYIFIVDRFSEQCLILIKANRI